MKSNLIIAFVVVSVMYLVPPSHSAKILGFLLTPIRSHYIIHESLLKGLATQGHEITVLGIFPPPQEEIPNYRYLHVPIDARAEALMNTMKKRVFLRADSNEQFFSINQMFESFPAMLGMMASFVANPVVEQLKQEAHFDLVVYSYLFLDFNLGIAAHFQCPSVIISATQALKGLRDYIGNPSGVAVNEFGLLSLAGQMTFTQRIIHFAYLMLETAFMNAMEYFINEPYYRHYFPPSRYPSYSEAKKNVSLVLVTSHFSQGKPRATFPGLLEVSGIHIKKTPSPLPDNIKEWLDSATDGAIFFSFGTNTNSSQMSTEKREAIMNVLATLKQKTLWKWDAEQLLGKPDNVMVSKWLPQDDVLAHPNIQLFISHCGKGSINEARYHGVPILGIPMFADQPSNAIVIVEEGWAIQLNYADLTEESFKTALNEILNNPVYRQTVKKAADLYKDRPAHPLDTAIYWIEYVLRHNGAKHMQSQAVHLNWFQYHSIDVIGLLIVVFYVSWKLLVCSLKFLFKKCTTASKVKNE